MDKKKVLVKVSFTLLITHKWLVCKCLIF
jgi:hypothetical protein